MSKRVGLIGSKRSDFSILAQLKDVRLCASGTIAAICNELYPHCQVQALSRQNTPTNLPLLLKPEKDLLLAMDVVGEQTKIEIETAKHHGFRIFDTTKIPLLKEAINAI